MDCISKYIDVTEVDHGNRTRFIMNFKYEMNLYHRQKVNIASAALKYGRMRNIRRDTLIHQDSLSKSLTDFERLSEHNKIKNLKYHILDCGTYTSDVCCPKYFEVLPMLDQLEIEPLSETLKTTENLISEESFLDSSTSIPPLESVPEVSELPSFLGTDFGTREGQKSGRMTRSKSARFNPIL